MCREGTNEGLVSATVAKTARSISEAARARPTTKLLDADALPKLEAPTHPFRRLQTPLKFSESPSAKKQEDKRHKLSKRRRPLPDKKWRKVVSREEKLVEEIGMHINPLTRKCANVMSTALPCMGQLQTVYMFCLCLLFEQLYCIF